MSSRKKAIQRGVGREESVKTKNENGLSPQSELIQATTKLLVSGDYSDMTIICGDTFKVHRSIVCPRSAFFSAACVSGFQEARSGVVRLPDDDPSTVERMINYLYKLNYNDETDCITPSPVETIDTGSSEPTTSTASGDTSLQTHITSPLGSTSIVVNAQVYILADKYQVLGLKELSKAKFEARVKEHWNDKIFSHAIREVYQSTPEEDRGLRHIVAKTAWSHIYILRDRGEFIAVLRDVHQFAFDVLQLAVDDLPEAVPDDDQRSSSGASVTW